MPDRTEVDLGFIGLGNIARIHCDRLIESGYESVIAGGLDVDAQARGSFAAEYDTAVYEEQTALYDDVDAVLVTTPNKFHEEYVINALDAGLDVFVEKPLAHTVESARRIAEAAREAEGFCMVGFHNRFRPPVQVLRGYCRDGTMGDISHIEAHYMRRRGIPGRGSWFTRKEIAGGGSLIDIGVHAIDLSLYLLDFPDVVEVSGHTRSQFGPDEEYAYVSMWGEDQGPEGFTVDDSSTAFIRCANGATISMEIAWAANRPDSQQYVVRGREAGACLDFAEDSLTLYETAGGEVNHHRTTEVTTAGGDPHTSIGERFLDAVAAGEPPGTNTVEEALTVQRVLDAIYRSSKHGRAIELDE